uniref:Uncharacterized protein n=1 Tax=Lactuca sativa TaxID=4236 RepID=A0A9R1V3C9_LACSA|nr:hypothetical protein LSAT_V11C700370090 [Lactuca sativa]
MKNVSSEITGEIRSLETPHNYERRENMGEEQQHQDDKENKDLGQFSKPTIQWLNYIFYYEIIFVDKLLANLLEPLICEVFIEYSQNSALNPSF